MKISLLISLIVSGFSAFGRPGDLVAVIHLNDIPGLFVSTARQVFCPAETNTTTNYGFKRYKIDYKSTGLKGEEVSTSGLLIVPDTTGVFPMFVYQHGTLFGRSELPSSNPAGGEGDAMGYCYASLGYVAVLADYLGFGDSTGVHPYLHANSEAWVARDMMRASKTALAQLNVQMNSELFVAGYSQGGHAAMSLLRFLEQDPTHEFTVTAAAPMAGPYHLSATIESLIGSPGSDTASEGAYLVMGLNPIYGFFQNLTDVFQANYTSVVSTLFDGTHNSSNVASALSMPLAQLFQPTYLQLILTNPNSPFVDALKDNDVYQWVPKTPLHLYQGGGDQTVPFSNSQEAYDYMSANGANIQLINLGATVDHLPGFPLAIGQAAMWFQSLR